MKPHPSKRGNSFPAWVVVVPVLVLLLGAALWWLNSGYGKTSEKGYQFATALFSACNRKNSDKLQEIATMLDASQAAGELGQAEFRDLRTIVDVGLAGNWTEASRRTRALMEAQVEPAANR